MGFKKVIAGLVQVPSVAAILVALFDTKLLAASTTVGSTVVNTTVNTAFTPTYTVVGNTLKVGSVIDIEAYGVLTTGLTPGTLTLRFRWANVNLVATAATAITASLTDAPWRFRGRMICHAVGATLTAECSGVWQWNNGTPITIVPTTQASSSSTGNVAVSLQAAWSIAAVDNSITMRSVTYRKSFPTG